MVVEYMSLSKIIMSVMMSIPQEKGRRKKAQTQLIMYIKLYYERKTRIEENILSNLIQ